MLIVGIAVMYTLKLKKALAKQHHRRLRRCWDFKFTQEWLGTENCSAAATVSLGIVGTTVQIFHMLPVEEQIFCLVVDRKSLALSKISIFSPAVYEALMTIL